MNILIFNLSNILSSRCCSRKTPDPPGFSMFSPSGGGANLLGNGSQTKLSCLSLADHEQTRMHDLRYESLESDSGIRISGKDIQRYPTPPGPPGRGFSQRDNPQCAATQHIQRLPVKRLPLAPIRALHRADDRELTVEERYPPPHCKWRPTAVCVFRSACARKAAARRSRRL